MENEEIDDGLPSIEELRRARAENAARARSVAAMEPWLGGAGGPPGPFGSAVAAVSESPLGKASAKFGEAVDGVKTWTKNLPRNIGMGLLDATVNSLDALDDIASTIGDFHQPGGEDEQLPPREERSPTPMEAYQEWRNTLRDDDSMADSVTQGVAQFVAPFMAWSKLTGVSSKLSTAQNLLRAGAAEAATAATVYSPHEGRAADLYALGQQTEGKLAAALNTMAPDGSLLNSYIDYMTDREDEGIAEGRFKNALDSVVTSAALFGVLKSAATTLKAARQVPEAMAQPSVRPGSRKSQEGKIVFHGTPHDFDKFDINKIGTGEGHQTYGHGLYFAEDKGVAGHYRKVLSRAGAPVGSAMAHATDALSAASGDAVAAYQALAAKRRAAASLPDQFEAIGKAMELVKSGNAKIRGKLMSVEIPDDVIAKMVDYDSLMSTQKPVLDKLPSGDRDQLEKFLDDYSQPSLEELSGNEFQQLIGKAIQEDVIHFDPPDGVFDSRKKLAAQYLNSIGIPGIRYLDGTSRKAGEGTRNIVLFDDKLATIKSKE